MGEPNGVPFAAAGVDLLRALLEAAPDALVVVGEDGRIVLVNAQAERLFGYLREELLGKTVEMLLPQRFQAQHPRHRAGYLDAPKAREMGAGLDLFGRRKDGTEFPLEISLSPIRTVDGVLVSSAIRDVTERKRMEAALREASRRTDEAELVTKRGSWEWDVTTDRAIWSRGMYRLFGLDADTFANTNENFLAMVHPEDRDRMAAAMAAALADPGPFLQEYRLTRPDGPTIHIRGEGNVHSDKLGKARLLYGFVQDVTERKRTERALQETEASFTAVFHSLPLPFAIMRGTDGAYLEINDAFTNTLGWRREDVLGKNAVELGMLDEAGTAKALEGIDPTHAVAGRDIRIKTRAGGYVDVLASMAHVRWNGQACVASGFLDVTQAKKAAEQIRQSNEFKSNFLNMVAHDLNNIVTPMRLAARTTHLMLAQGKAPEASKSLASLDRSVERISAFLADLLDAARLQAGALKVTPTMMDVSGALADAIEAAQAEAKQRGIRLEAEIPRAIQAYVHAQRLEQVTANILGNSLKFTPAGGEIRITLSRKAGEIQVEIADTGPGIGKDDQAKLFQPFTQLRAAGQGKHTGTGLGLFICKGIIEAHHGRIWCESEEGRGAKFFFTLPAAPPA